VENPEVTVVLMPAARVLFVDDEPNIALTMPVILRQHGYDVTGVGSVNEALAQISATPFDVLISDLNIGHPGDGFTVVSAMRRTHPTCITLILTGYPGFDTALEAIRSQVDDYLIKPAPIPNLIKLIEQKLKNPKSGHVVANKRVAQILRERVFEITQRALQEMKSDPLLGALPLADELRIEHTPRTVEELAAMLESTEPAQPRREMIQSAAARGEKRYKQGYSIPQLATCVRLLERAIFDVIHEHMLSLNLSYFMFDLKRLSDMLGLQLEHMLIAYLDEERRSPRLAGQPR
jgi:ActR/RegA family two-component response regulator